MREFRRTAGEKPFVTPPDRFNPGTVALWIGNKSIRMGYTLNLSPAEARELAADLLNQAKAAESNER